MAHTATILFTDLVGSTALATALSPEGADELRRTHFALLREGVAAFGGDEVKNLGDGLMVAFSSVRDAVGCAVAMQQAIDRHNRRGEKARLGIRVGISIGDVTSEDHDYYGIAVVEAARLCAQAQGGEILCPDVVRSLAGGPGGYTFQPLGALELKGLAEPVPTSRVTWEPLHGGLPLPPGLSAEFRLQFIGRSAERAGLEGAWKAAAAGARRVVLVWGEPGIGKTRLVTDAALAAHADGATVLYGRCDEEHGMPYQPFVEALRHYVAVCPTSELSAVREHGGPLAQLVPEVARRVPELSPGPHSDAGTEQQLLPEAIIAILAAASRRVPVVLVLDDLHSAPKPTLRLIRHLVHSTEPMGLLVLGAYRHTELDREHALIDVFADLGREDGVDRVALGGLSHHEVFQLMRSARRDGHEPDIAVARALRDNTEGSPFLIGELLNALSAPGATLESIVLPDSVRESTRRRLSRLSTLANRVLEVAAVIGHSFDVTLLCRAGDVTPEESLGALHVAAAAGLVRADPDTMHRFTFANAVVRQAVYDELPSPRRISLHRRIAEDLEATRSDRLADLANHWFAATSPAGAPSHQLAKAIDYAERAAERAGQERAYSQAAGHYRHAEQLLEGTDPWSRRHCELLLVLGDVESRAGEASDARDAFRRAAELARRLGERELLALAALGYGLGPGDSPYVAGVDETLVGLLEEALSGLDGENSVLRVRLLSRLAVELHLTGFVERREALSRQAVEMAQQTGDASAQLVAVYSWLMATWSPDELPERLAGADDVLRRARELDDREMRFRGHRIKLRALLEVGEIAAIDDEIAALEEAAVEIGQPFYTWQSRLTHAMRALHDGRADEGERLMLEAVEIGRGVDGELATRSFSAQVALHRWLTGRTRELVPLLREGAESCPWLHVRRARLAFGLADLGRKTEAIAEFERLAQDDFASLSRDGSWLMTMGFLAFTCALLADKPRAEILHDVLDPYADRWLASGDCTTTWGPVATALGVLAAALGRYGEATDHFERALERNVGAGAQAQTVFTQREFARMLLTRRRLGDLERASALLDEAGASARRNGFAGMTEQVAALRAAAAVGR